MVPSITRSICLAIAIKIREDAWTLRCTVIRGPFCQACCVQGSTDFQNWGIDIFSAAQLALVSGSHYETN